jgi:serine/threonine protein kinase
MENLIVELSKSSLFTVVNQTIAVTHTEADQTQQAVELLGTIVDHKYKIIELLGSGGMGSVYLARHLMLDKDVALKTFKSSKLSQEERLRFQREAQAIAKLTNANIIEVFDFGYVNGEMPYYTMERLVGQSLGGKLESCQFLSFEEATSTFTQVCSGLSAAHKKGIIHRDLKPDNIFLQSKESKNAASTANTVQVKIVDFGIAALSSSPLDKQKLTEHGTVFGSPLYMSPEQSMGQPVNESSDIYSCGCALFQALVGKPPFFGTNALTTILLHQTAPIPSLRDAMNGRPCPASLEKLVTTMLAKSPNDRYQSMEEVLERLQRLEKVTPDARTTNSEGIEKEVQIERQFYEDPDEIQNKGLIVNLSVIFVSVCTTAIAAYIYLSTGIDSSPKPLNTAPIGVPTHVERTDQKIQTSLDPGKYPDESAIPDLQVEKFEQRLKTPTVDLRLSVTHNSILQDKEMERISQTKWIRSLNLSRCTFSNKSLARLKKLDLKIVNFYASNFDDEGAQCLSKIDTLQEVRVHSTAVTDEGVENLCKIAGLKRLFLGSTPITDKSLFQIAKCKNLNYLNLAAVQNISNVGLRQLAGIKSLQFIGLDRTKVDLKCVQQLCKANKNIKTINLVECPNIDAMQVNELRRKFPRVTFVDKIPLDRHYSRLED